MNKTLRAKALRGMVKVRHAPRSWGTGFLVGGSYLVTAAHCLPRSPDTVNYFPGDDRIEVKVRALSGGPSAAALVCFADAHSDCAVISDFGCGGEFAAEASGNLQAKFNSLVGSLGGLPLRLKDLPLREPIRVHVFTSRGAWVSGKATAFDPRGWSLYVEFSKAIPGGTSGSPVFDDDGRVVGVVSSSGEGTSVRGYATTVVRLPHALPVWIQKALSSESEGGGTSSIRVSA